MSDWYICSVQNADDYDLDNSIHPVSDRMNDLWYEIMDKKKLSEVSDVVLDEKSNTTLLNS